MAIRADGRRYAAAHESGVDEYDVGLEAAAVFHTGVPVALVYAADASLVAAAGSRVGPPGVEAGDGSPIVELAAASGVPRVAARHADGTISLWEVGRAEPLASWASPVADAGSIALSADGALVALGTPDAEAPVAALASALDGAQVRRIEGARLIAPAPEPETYLVAGDWGSAWLEPLEED